MASDADIRSASAGGGNRLVIADLTRRNEAELVAGEPATVRFDASNPSVQDTIPGWRLHARH